jgi:dienelactone hydrolase
VRDAAVDYEAFEAVSRGDFVRGLLWLGAGNGPRPLVVVTPALGSDKHATEIATLCRALCKEGLAAAAIDLPLQGERASTKLSERLRSCATHSERAATDRLLWEAFLRQSALDIAAVTEALAPRPELRLDRLACLAFEPGGEAGAGWASHEPRVRACRVLARGADPARIASDLREQLA